MFPRSLAFDPLQPAWDAIPAAPGVFALFGADERSEPYISRTPSLRRRLRRLLDPRPEQSKRLRLAGSVARIEYALTGSDFEALLLLYNASCAVYGERARKRMHLRPPHLLRMTAENAYPRAYVTNKVTKSGMADLFGPFPSRAAADSFLEGMLDLFLLRRCWEDIHPDPSFPGCVYSEMKKCLAPCFQGCSDERYAEEAAAVRAFLRTRGASLAGALRREREQASELLEFERAADLHARLAKAEAVAAQAPECMRPLSQLEAVVVQAAAEPECVALFLLEHGELRGPALYSVAGMRHPNESAGSTSLFAQPVAVDAVPLDAPAVTLASRDELEQRLDAALAELRAPQVHSTRRKTSSAQLADYLCLFSRWCYRPQSKRIGEFVLADEEGQLPRKAVLRAISRVFQKSLKSEPPTEAR
jgi:excinuclease UvrABC nuclease subunit